MLQVYWGEQQSKAFKKIKQILSREETLGNFNIKDNTSVIGDASPVGLGAVLIQNLKIEIELSVMLVKVYQIKKADIVRQIKKH